MSWIDDINKKLEEQRTAYKQSIESGETFIRHQKYANKCADGKGGKVSAELYGGKFFTEWQNNNPEEFKEAAARGGHTQGTINAELGLGFFSASSEERSEFAKIGNKAFWDNATPEQIEAKYKKHSKSMKKFIAENGYWNPHQYITPELQKQMAANMSKTKLKKREQRIKDLYDTIDTNDWFNLEYATTILASISNKGVSESTTRRMIHGWNEASKYFEFRKTSYTADKKLFMEWRKKDIAG